MPSFSVYTLQCKRRGGNIVLEETNCKNSIGNQEKQNNTVENGLSDAYEIASDMYDFEGIAYGSQRILQRMAYPQRFC